MHIIDGDWVEEKHYKDYIIRAVRHGNDVEIWDLFPKTGGSYIHTELSYNQFLNVMENNTLCSVFGANY